MSTVTIRGSFIAGVALAVLTIAAPVAAQQNSAPPLPDPGALGAVNDHKAAYLALSASSPERLPMGLTLIRDRFEVATGEEVHRLRKARMENQQTVANQSPAVLL